MRRAAPLPNSVRSSAVILSLIRVLLVAGDGPRKPRAPRFPDQVTGGRAASYERTGPVDHGVTEAGAPSPRQPDETTRLGDRRRNPDRGQTRRGPDGALTCALGRDP